MKMKIKTLSALAILPIAALAITSCSRGPNVDTTTVVTTQPGVPGGVVVETHTITATVTGIDKTNRHVMLVTPDGFKQTVTAGPDVANFDQIQVGDQFKATLAEQLVVFVRDPGGVSGDGEASAVALAPVGAKPGALMVNTEVITAKVKSIDVEHQKATLEFPDGSTRTVKVRKDVDLSKQAVGAEVVIRTTEALAISLEKP
ncbi:MAG: hypothetical protein U1F98_12380 [Verrucomicrobiota bacterium]